LEIKNMLGLGWFLANGRPQLQHIFIALGIGVATYGIRGLMGLYDMGRWLSYGSIFLGVFVIVFASRSLYKNFG
jgi:hypothetical protein